MAEIDTHLHEDVKDYYKEKTSRRDFKTSACATLPSSKIPNNVKNALTKIHDVIITKYYGCGLPIPDALEGISVVDLGCGTGRDVYLLSQLVGPNGFVVGVDMTDEQLNVAREYVDYHMKEFGYDKPNVDFKKGNIERLGELGMAGRFDLIVSNCVVNLAMDKKTVLKGAWELLKEGGEFYFSDIYSSTVIPDRLRKDKMFWGECLSGALYWKELLEICEEIGFSKPAIYESKFVPLGNKDIEKPLKDANLQFASITYRFFKLDKSNTSSMGASYKGTIAEKETEFRFSEGIAFQTNKEVNVNPELAQIFYQSRYKNHFQLSPSTSEGAKIKEIDPFTVCNIFNKNSGGCCVQSNNTCGTVSKSCESSSNTSCKPENKSCGSTNTCGSAKTSCEPDNKSCGTGSKSCAL